MDCMLFFVVLFGVCNVSASDTDTDLNCTNPHEVPACLVVCPGQKTCVNYHYEIPCLPLDDPCKPQCVCGDGYRRNYDGKCITDAQCEQCLPNVRPRARFTEHFTCNGPYSEDCQGSCVCNYGYERDASNTCVSTSPPPVIASPPPNPRNPPVDAGPDSTEPPSDITADPDPASGDTNCY